MAVVDIPSDSVILDQCACVSHKPQALHLSGFAHGNSVLGSQAISARGSCLLSMRITAEWVFREIVPGADLTWAHGP